MRTLDREGGGGGLMGGFWGKGAILAAEWLEN